MNDLERVFIPPRSTLRQAMEALNRSGAGIVLVVDEQRRLLGTITDGDLRRALLGGQDLDGNLAEDALARPPESPHRHPLTVPPGTPPVEVLALMTRHRVHQVPIVEPDGRVVDVALESDLAATRVPLTAVVMAGGRGTRLRPLTDSVPKPMLRVGDRPVIQRIVEQLGRAGISDVNITTHYKPEQIVEHLGDGSRFGLHIEYVEELEPMGTAGALALMKPPQGTVLVINGDVLTRVDFRAMLAFHREHQADMTVGVRRFEIKVPYGVIQHKGARITGLAEKPTLSQFVNGGIYLIEPRVFALIEPGKRTDATNLVDLLVAENRTVVAFPIHEYWVDIGDPADYDRANEDWSVGN
jgi:dTDP-glucose pyrophosphorylase/CBS domain-containing protein